MLYKHRTSIKKAELEHLPEEKRAYKIEFVESRIKEEMFKKIAENITVRQVEEDPNYPETGELLFASAVVVMPIEQWLHVKSILKALQNFGPKREDKGFEYDIIHEIENK